MAHIHKHILFIITVRMTQYTEHIYIQHVHSSNNGRGICVYTVYIYMIYNLYNTIYITGYIGCRGTVTADRSLGRELSSGCSAPDGKGQVRATANRVQGRATRSVHQQANEIGR